MSNPSKIDLHILGEQLRNLTGSHITKKESQIMVLIANKWTVHQIAEYVCRSEKTIYKHIENAKVKLACKTQADLSQRIAMQLGVMC